MIPSTGENHPMAQAQLAARRFGERLNGLVEAGKITKTEIEKRSGLAYATIERQCLGENEPQFKTFVAITRAVSRDIPEAAVLLGREIVDLFVTQEKLDADLNKDGKIDVDDMLAAVGQMMHQTDALFRLTIEAIADGRITDEECTQIVQANQKLRNAANIHQQIAMMENDKESRANAGRLQR